ncbi:hydroxysqualene dehydroxylase [Nitrospira sp. Nam74]
MKPTALVVGSTLAGLTTALRLGQRGYAVTLIEHALPPEAIGGRQNIDPLPFVLMGGHTATRALLETLGTSKHVQHDDKIRFELLLSDRRPVRLRRPPLPAPLHALAGLAIFPGMPARDRWRFLMWVERTWEQDPALPPDLDSHTAEAWLRGIGQSDYARVHVWSPLSRFLLGDDVKTVSAGALLTTLMRHFLSSRSHSQLAIPLLTIDQLLHQPLRQALLGMGVTIKTEYVDRIEFDMQKVTGIQPKADNRTVADWYILALPHQCVTALLPERLLTRFSYFQHIGELADTPAVAVYLRLDAPILSPRVILLAGRTFHWMCLTPAADTPQTHVSLVITGPSGLERSDDDLLKSAGEDLHRTLPDIGKTQPIAHHIVRSPRACLSMKPGMTTHRPLQQSPFPNLFLSGDWTDTGVPGTVESAIVSGDRCAQMILDKS